MTVLSILSALLWLVLVIAFLFNEKIKLTINNQRPATKGERLLLGVVGYPATGIIFYLLGIIVKLLTYSTVVTISLWVLFAISIFVFRNSVTINDKPAGPLWRLGVVLVVFPFMLALFVLLGGIGEFMLMPISMWIWGQKCMYYV